MVSHKGNPVYGRKMPFWLVVSHARRARSRTRTLIKNSVYRSVVKVSVNLQIIFEHAGMSQSQNVFVYLAGLHKKRFFVHVVADEITSLKSWA